ncbi:MAG: nicotinamide mononucleotide transporter [Leptolyngbya sp. SIO3F4]|nr:nicotinamide mononucleotide transporter [Leptolyngbya sp. SIO3F4]
MESWTDSLLRAAQAMDPLEAVAVVCSILYLWLAGRESLWCWLFAAISVVLYMILLVEANLWAETGLQVYYLFMAGYGYYSWKTKRVQEARLERSTKALSFPEDERPERPITTLSLTQHVGLIALIGVLTVATGFALQTYTSASLPFLDSFTTWGAVVTTWMVTRKYLENWLYWIVVDGVGIYLYASRELYLTSFLFAAYVVMVIVGYFHWRNLYRQQTA